MPIIDGKYVNPGWVDGESPDIDADELNAISDTCVSSTELAEKNLLNILRLKLQVSLSASDIDAWADLLDDASQLNITNLVNIEDGNLKPLKIEQLSCDHDHSGCIGQSATSTSLGQTFISPYSDFTLNSCTFNLSKYGSPTDNLIVELYDTADGLPNSLIATSTTTLSGLSIVSFSGFADYQFLFNNIQLSKNVKYAITIRRSGNVSNHNYYFIGGASTANAYPTGYCVIHNTDDIPYWHGSTTPATPADLYFKLGIVSGTSEAIWNPVTSTEVLSKIAVTADQTEGAGTITWYVSNDGATWIEIANLDEMQSVDFTSTSIYLKCVLTADAVVSSVAWGGY